MAINTRCVCVLVCVQTCLQVCVCVCSQLAARLLFPPSGPIERPGYSRDEGVMYNWRAGLKLITLLTPGTHWQLEIDLSARAWFANELPLAQPSPSPSPPLPRLPPSLVLFLFLVHSVPRSSFYIVPWQMLCRAAIVPHQFFWGRESQKISTCDFNTSVPPAV